MNICENVAERNHLPPKRSRVMLKFSFDARQRQAARRGLLAAADADARVFRVVFAFIVFRCCISHFYFPCCHLASLAADASAKKPGQAILDHRAGGGGERGKLRFLRWAEGRPCGPAPRVPLAGLDARIWSENNIKI